MNAPKYKLLVTWNIVLTTLLIVTLAVAAISVQAANDPPVEVFSATYDHAAGTAGTSTGTDKTISSTTYTDLLTVPVNFTGQNHNHYCAIVASANVKNPGNGTGHYYDFGVGYDSSSAASLVNSVMRLELGDNGGVDDPSWMPVTTNRLFDAAFTPAAHTIRFQARKVSAADPNVVIDNASISVFCFKKLQTASLQVDEPAQEDNVPNDQ